MANYVIPVIWGFFSHQVIFTFFISSLLGFDVDLGFVIHGDGLSTQSGFVETIEATR